MLMNDDTIALHQLLQLICDKSQYRRDAFHQVSCRVVTDDSNATTSTQYNGWLHFLDLSFAESKDWAESLIWTLILGLSPKPD